MGGHGGGTRMPSKKPRSMLVTMYTVLSMFVFSTWKFEDNNFIMKCGNCHCFSIGYAIATRRWDTRQKGLTKTHGSEWGWEWKRLHKAQTLEWEWRRGWKRIHRGEINLVWTQKFIRWPCILQGLEEESVPLRC
jgi:hypothetical protein